MSNFIYANVFIFNHIFTFIMTFTLVRGCFYLDSGREIVFFVSALYSYFEIYINRFLKFYTFEQQQLCLFEQ